MTISAVSAPRVVYTGAGTLGPFSVAKGGVAITFSDNSHIQVTRFSSSTAQSGTVLVEDTDYTLTGGPDAGIVTLISPAQAVLASTDRLLIERIQPKSQALDLSSGGNFSSSAIEARHDREVEMIAESWDRASRSLEVHFLDGSMKMLPPKSELANNVLGFDANGDPTVGDLSGVSDLVGFLDDITIVAAADVDIGIVADNITDMTTVADDIANVNLVGAALDAGTIADLLDGQVGLVADYTALKALGSTELDAGRLYMMPGRRGGVFEIVSDSAGNVTAALAADPQEGVRVSLTNGGGTKYARRILTAPGEYVWDWFGAAGDGSTDDYDAIQACVDFAGSNVQKKQGGLVRPGPYIYACSDTIVLDQYGVFVEGIRAWGSITSDDDAQDDEIGAIIGTFTAGPIFHIQVSDCGVRRMTIKADATREAASITTGTGNRNCGILVEPDDTASASIKRIHIADNMIWDQPADGIYYCGNIIQITDERNNVARAGGHGIVADAGYLCGRTNKSRPGEIDIRSARIKDCGGHMIAIGNPSQGTDLPYRVDIEDVEGFRCANDAAVRFGDYGSYIFAEQVRTSSSAWDGTNASDVATRLCLLVAGRDILLEENRYINGTHFLHIDEVSGSGVTTENVKVVGGRAATTGSAPSYFAEVDTNCVNVTIDQPSGSASTLVNTTAVSGGLTLIEDNITKHYYRDVEVSEGYSKAEHFGPVRSFTPVTLADDECMTINLGGRAHGKLIVSGNTTGRGYAEVWFRAGGTPHCNKLVESGVTVAVGTTALSTGTSDGVDGQLNIAAVSDENIYIKNRTAGSGVYSVTLLSMDGETGWVASDPTVI